MTDAGTDLRTEPTPDELRTIARLRAGDEAALEAHFDDEWIRQR